MIEEKKPFKFFISHVDADDQFLRIWAQTDFAVMQNVSLMLVKIDEVLCYNPVCFPQSPLPVNTNCCARRTTNEFARARVINSRSDGMYKVFFIDFGDSSLVDINNIRVIDQLPQGQFLFNLPNGAIPFVLNDITPVGGYWMPEVISSIREILLNNPYVGSYININGYKCLKFNRVEGVDFSKELISRNMAQFHPFVQQIKQNSAPVQSLLVQQVNSGAQQENWRGSIPKIAKRNSFFKAIQLEIGATYDVIISYVENGPWKFSIQLKESLPVLGRMMAQINSQSHIPLQEPPIAGAVCLGKDPITNSLCRVVLNSPGNTSCRVYFADFGHHEVLTFDQIYQIPDEFVGPNLFSIRFTLSGIMNWTASNEMNNFFWETVRQQPLKLTVCKGPMSPLTQYCELYIQGKSIKEILAEHFPNQCRLLYLEPKHLKVGSVEIVFVTHVISPAKFFVQLENYSKNIDDIMDQIEEVSKTAEHLTLTQIYPNMPCIALYNGDNKWYRASVINITSNNTAKVFYVDYGNEETVPLHNLRAIPTNLVNALSKQAIACSLHGFSSESVDEGIKKNFESLVLEERLSLKVLNVLPDTVAVSLYDNDTSSSLNGTDIIEKLRNSGAIPNQTLPILDESNRRQNNMSFKPLQVNNENESWNSNSPKGAQNQFAKVNQTENCDMSKSKFPNQPRKSSDYSSNSEFQSNRFDKEIPKYDRFNNHNDKFVAKSQEYQNNFGQKDYSSNNERFNKSSMPRNNAHESNDHYTLRGRQDNHGSKINANGRMDRSFGSDKIISDKDSDTSSRGSGRRNGRAERRNTDDQRKRNEKQSNNRPRIGRWENDEQDSSYKNTNNSSINAGKMARDNSSNFNKSDWDSSKDLTNNKETARYVTSTPISKIPPPNITVGAVKNCEMVYYTDPSSFYVQLLPDNEELQTIMSKISSIYHTSGKILEPQEVKVDLQCIAQYSEDNEWYRAVVKSVESEAATVHFVDYGNVETVSFCKIKEIEPEFLKLPAQAIHCKLFCPSKINWTKEEIDSLSDELYDQTIETEFVTEDNGIYQVLMKTNSSKPKYVNDRFCNGLNLNQEKDAIRNKTRSTTSSERLQSKNFAPLNEKWLNNEISLGTKYEVLLAWFINPENFYCQLLSTQQEFRNMMNELQNFYVKQSPVSETLSVEDSVIAVLPDDGVLYRAEILELNKPRGHVVQYVDYGDRAMVNPRKIYPVDKKFKQLPRQAIPCALINIAPVPGSNWANPAAVNKFFASDKLECVFHEMKNGRYLISLTANGSDIGSTLVEKNLAAFASVPSSEVVKEIPNNVENVIEHPEIPRVDISLLEGQTLLVKVSHVENVGKFYVQFPAAESCQAIIDNYMEKSDPKMVKLPGQLAVMQNQSIECKLFDVPMSLKADETLKKLIIGKDVKIFVEKVEGNRLIVRLFDIDGNKIKVVDSQNTEKISPLCNMQILSSTHDVVVTWANNANSVWLQRTSETSLEQDFLQTLYEHYSKIGQDQQVNVEVGKLYAALSTVDDNWYRVKVTNVKETLASVIFMDYGNIEDIPLTNFRKLESQFYLPHQLAVEVSLTVKLNVSNEEQLASLQNILYDKTFSATLFNVNRKWMAELSENGQKLSEKLASLDIFKEVTKTQFEFKELPEMSVGERYKVFVSHVDNPSQLWLHRAENVKSLEELQRQIEEVSSHAESLTEKLEEKSLYLAKDSLDNNWYRAEVLDADDEAATVRFIDYGKAGVVDNNPDFIKQLPEKWKSIARYAIQCKLDLLPVDNDDWTDEVCKWTSKLCTEPAEPLEVIIIADKSPMRIDLFLPNDQSVCKMLIDKGLAAPAQSSQQSEEQVIEDAGEEDEPLDPRSAFVSSAVSVDEFYMQEEVLVNDLEAMEDRLMMSNLLEPLEKIEEGLLCVAHFSQDNNYYRATVLSHNKEGTTVRYIDYGNISVTTDLKKIPDDMAKIRPLSRKCCLAKPDGVDKWPASINEEFCKLANNGVTVFLLDVIEEGETSLVKLTHESKDVAIKLIEICGKTHLSEDEGIVEDDSKISNTSTQKEERPSPIGQENSHSAKTLFSDVGICGVTHIISPSEFFIQNANHFSQIDELAVEMENSENFPMASEPFTEGKILAAKFEADGEWYRSKILSHGDKGVEVLYIDYGNSALTTPSDLRELPEDLAQIPAFTTCCSLRLPPNLESWPKSACEKFINLVDAGRTEFEFKVLDSKADFGNSVEVCLIYKNQDVVDILLNKDAQSVEKVLSNEMDEQSKDLKDNNASCDSANISEMDQPVTSVIDNFDKLNIEHPKTSNSSETSSNTGCSAEVSEIEKTVIVEEYKQNNEADELLQNRVSNENLTECSTIEHKSLHIVEKQTLLRSTSNESKCSSLNENIESSVHKTITTSNLNDNQLIQTSNVDTDSTSTSSSSVLRSENESHTSSNDSIPTSLKNA